MGSKNTSENPVGVIGLGTFGTAIANLLSRNSPVFLYGRNPDAVRKISSQRICCGQRLNDPILVTNDLSALAERCEIIFPVVPSASFREMMKILSVHLRPYHILIHGTKGLDVDADLDDLARNNLEMTMRQVHTISQVITEESVVMRVGCMAGPNIARELSENLPAATVIASDFDEVISEGQRLLRSERFQVYGSSDLVGIELAGVLKNIIAIAAGAISGLKLGENARGLLISRGLVEMIYLGRAMGGDVKAFMGLAGVGDLVTTCTSELSRNYTVGFRLARGEKINDIINTMDETAEGINTVRITKYLTKHLNFRAPITEKLFEMMFEGLPADKALQYLMKYPLNIDVDFL
ncbi:MAG TPA: NAD(P)H-dependent glycerol-3-phosphate dehydrogenase [Cyclobacteriaceae bacterium]|nr:NAD(P)H-dependent glycerol-3-phosphate dehydrogenase [Cyclobacteriaceae bacterium]